MNNTTAESYIPGTAAVHESLILPTVSMSVNVILGVPLNAYVIWLILRAPRETMASDFFSLNLAVSEFFFAASGISFLIYVKFYLIFSQSVFIFCLGLLYTARPLFQCCICVECYTGVVHPVMFLRLKPLRYKAACCSVFWLIILISCIYSFKTFANLHFLYGYFIQSVLLFSVMLFCCLSVLWALKRPGPGDGDTQRKTSNGMKRKAFKIILIIMTFMTINFSFYMAAIPLQSFIALSEFFKIFGICLGIALTTGFIQPLLYLHRARKLTCMKI